VSYILGVVLFLRIGKRRQERFLNIKPNRASIGVLGAGIMGCCLALELARKGYQVDLLDRESEPVRRASLHNEGKLHLGFVYANDPLKTTHHLMARGSLTFSRIFTHLTGCQPDDLLPSQPFHYFVPIDSQLGLNDILEHFHQVDEVVRELSMLTGDLYLGRKMDRLFEINPPDIHQELFSSSMTLGSFATKEVSVSPVAAAKILRRAVQHCLNINFMGGATVLSASPRPSGDIEVEVRREGTISKVVYPCVVNCLWEDKLKIDKSAGIQDEGPWFSRYKAAISVLTTGTSSCQIPSATGVLGSYGDVVNYGNGTLYLSWYPLCKRAEGINENGATLRDKVHPSPVARFARKWSSPFPPLSQYIASLSHKRFIQENINELSAYIPSLSELRSTLYSGQVGGGIILARGATDIDDPNSRLHQRTEIGPRVYSTYITVDTGKYCTAPMFAMETANMVTQIV
jgi:hypothetical protein